MCKTVSKLLPLFLLALLWGLPLHAEELTEEQEQQLGALRDEAADKADQQDYQGASKTIDQALDKLKQWQSDKIHLLDFISLQVALLTLDANFDAARNKQKEALSLTQDIYGDEAPETLDAQVELNDFEKIAALTPEQQKELSEGDAAYRAAVAEGDLEKAIKLGEQMAAKEKKYLGEDCTWYTNSLSLLAENYTAAKKYKQAEKKWEECLSITERLFGPEHERTQSNLVGFALFYMAAERQKSLEAASIFRRCLQHGEKQLGEEHESIILLMEYLYMELIMLHSEKKIKDLKEIIQYASQLRRIHSKTDPEKYVFITRLLMQAYRKAGNLDAAINTGLESLERTKILGLEGGVLQGEILNELGLSYYSLGNHSKACEVYEKALPIWRLHKDEPTSTIPYYGSLMGFELALSLAGDHKLALEISKEAYAYCKRAFGEGDRRTANRLFAMANHVKYLEGAKAADDLIERYYQKIKQIYAEDDPLFIEAIWHISGHYMDHAPQKALPLSLQAVSLAEKSNVDPDLLAGVTQHLAIKLRILNDFEAAEAMYGKAIERMKQVPDSEEDVFSLMSGLGLLYIETGQPEKAIKLLSKIQNEPLAWNNLALAYSQLNQLDKALELHQRNLESELERKEQATNKSLAIYSVDAIAKTQANIASIHLRQGKLKSAISLLSQAIDGFSETHSDLDTARARNNLACVFTHTKDFNKAYELALEGMEYQLTQLENMAIVQAENQQLSSQDSLFPHVNVFLRAAAGADVAKDQAFEFAMKWKGQVTYRQRLYRSRAKEVGAEQSFDELQRVASQLSSLRKMSRDMNENAFTKQLNILTNKKQAIQKKISTLSSSLSNVFQDPSAQDLISKLPGDAALIDFVFVYDSENALSDFEDTDLRVAAFIVDKNGPIELVDLCDFEDFQRALATWKENLGQNTGPATELGKLIWEPLAQYVDDAELVLYSPIAELGSVPFAALPGKEPGSYLLEDKQLVMIPQAKLLPSLLEREQSPKPTVLAIGGVDYESVAENETEEPVQLAASRRAVRWNDEAVFSPLPETESELEAVGKLYNQQFDLGKLQTLKGDRATEAAVKRLAPQYSHLHFATHGFFAPPEVKSALDNSDNQFQRQLSFDDQPRFTGFHPGLLSGLALAGANDPPEEGEDGIWTAEEVATMNLSNVDLAVLSACETGLGKVAGGEGLLGLQRAFQVSGAGTTVASLWQVDDAATRALMDEFYRNLWEKKLPKIEALRQAQLKMLREYDPQKGKLRGVGGVRQLEANGQPERLPPFYWAAWVLSGDWR